MQHIVSESQACLTHPNTAPQQYVCLIVSVFHLVPSVMLSHLQVLPLLPMSEGRAKPDCVSEPPARIETCCAACTEHQAGSTNGCVAGTLPQSWGANGSFAALVSLEIGCGSNTSTGPDGITGSLPSEWASSETIQLLQTLIISSGSITGEHGFLGKVDDWYCV